MPIPLNELSIVSYASDCFVFATSTDVSQMNKKLNEHLETLYNAWFLKRNLKVSIEKSTSTLFTAWAKEVNIKDGQQLPTCQSPKIICSLSTRLKGYTTSDLDHKYWNLFGWQENTLKNVELKNLREKHKTSLFCLWLLLFILLQLVEKRACICMFTNVRHKVECLFMTISDFLQFLFFFLI